MGQAKRLATVALDEFTAYRLCVQAAIADLHIDEKEVRDIAIKGARADNKIVLLKRRTDLAATALTDVQNPRTIERVCAPNNLRVLHFDMDPEAA